MKKRELEMILQRAPPFPKPDAALEQYQTPAAVAGWLLFRALAEGDIEGKSVADLGCGTGIFAAGAKLLGAATVVGVDTSDDAIAAARTWTDSLGLEIEYVQSDVSAFSGTFDTVVMNPPFGAQRRNADAPFVAKALTMAPRVYSLHNGNSLPWVEKLAADIGARVEWSESIDFPLPRTYAHHTMRRQVVEVAAVKLSRG